MQLRDFGADADDGVRADATKVAFFSEAKALAPSLAVSGEVATKPVTASPCDMLQSGNGRYDSDRIVVTLSSLLTPTLY